MGLTDQSASISHCFAQWREQGSYALQDWKEAAGCLNHSLLHSSQLWQGLRPPAWQHLITVHHQEKPGQGQHSLWLRHFTHSTVNAKESGMASAGDDSWVCVGLRSRNSAAAMLQLLRELYSWKSLIVQRSRQERQTPCICLRCRELIQRALFPRRSVWWKLHVGQCVVFPEVSLRGIVAGV